jgi:Mg-chelatase subunit ChlD
MLKSIESFGLASKPEENSAAWALADGSESRYSEAESLRQQIESKQSELSSEAAKRKTSDSPFGFAQTAPVDSVAGDKLPRFAEQMPLSGADLGYLGDDPFGAEPSAPKPLSDVEGMESFGDRDPKPGMSDMGGLFGRGSNARGISTADSQQQAQSDPKKTEVQRKPDELLAELSDKPQDSKWDVANRAVRPDIALNAPDEPLMETRGFWAEERVLTEDFSIADEKGTITPARKGRQPAQSQSPGKESDNQPLDVTVLPDLLSEGKANASRSAESNEQETAWYRDLGRTKDNKEDLKTGSAIAGKELERRHQLQKKQASPGLNEILTETERFSTFSLHVSDVSFKLALDSLAKGQWPEATKIRVEEFLNAFDYQDPLPSEQEKVACRMEQAIHPFLMQRNLLRVAMRTSAVGRNSTTPLRLTLLLDNSGSMQRNDRAETVRRAFQTLAQQLNAADQVTLITFANEPKLRADRVKGDEVLNFVNILENSPVEGGTNLEAALRLALEKSLEAKTEGAQSRVILMTDGAVNLGDADPNNLSQSVLKMRDQGIAFDAAGISAQDLNDEVLEALTRQGDGRYYLLDNAEQVDAGFSQQIAGALRPSAKNVKIQVEFNPQRVRSYKLLGFEKHILNKEDFRNDKVDAAELAAAEAGNALYHYEILPDGIGDVGSVSVRFQDMTTGAMVEKRWPIAYEPTTPRMDQATPSMKLATSAVLFAAHLKGEPVGESVELPTIAEILSSLQSPYSNVERVQQLRQMVESARQIAGASSGNR